MRKRRTKKEERFSLNTSKRCILTCAAGDYLLTSHSIQFDPIFDLHIFAELKELGDQNLFNFKRSYAKISNCMQTNLLMVMMDVKIPENVLNFDLYIRLRIDKIVHSPKDLRIRALHNQHPQDVIVPSDVLHSFCLN